MVESTEGIEMFPIKLDSVKAQFHLQVITIVMADFNVKVGKWRDDVKIGKYWLETRNESEEHGSNGV